MVLAMCLHGLTFFIKFAKARYFYHSRLSIIEICQAVNSYKMFFLNFMFMVFVSFLNL